MKIWSLLPSATEILFTLGLGDQVTGVTHECDFPSEAAAKPRVTVSYIDSGLSSREIDDAVSSRLRQGLQLYGIEEGQLRSDPPDLIVTQDLCPVCAVSPSDIARHLDDAHCDAQIVTLNPNTLDDVLASIAIVGAATGRDAEACALVDDLRGRIAAVETAVASEPRRNVLTIEWLDPLMPGGHWVPEMVAAAGGCGGPIAPGEPSRKFAWPDLHAEDADAIVLMPCGFGPERGASEARLLWTLDGWSNLSAVRAGEVYVVDGNARYSRPGPRLVDGIEELARILHPSAWTQQAPAGHIMKLATGAEPTFAAYR